MTDPVLRLPTISAPEGETVGSHKFPWKPSEFVGLALVAASGLGIMAISNFAQGAVLFGGALIAVVPYFVWLSQARKKKSLIAVVAQGDRWLFTRRGIHDSSDSNVAADISRIRRIDIVNYTGMPDALVLLEDETDEGRRPALAVPSRLIRDPKFKERVAVIATQDGVEVTAKAKAALGL